MTDGVVASQLEKIMGAFKDKFMRDNYEAALTVFRTRHRDLFLPSGERRRSPNLGSSFAQAFWGGYDNLCVGQYRYPKNTLAYAYWKAGKDCAEKEPINEC